MCKPTDSTPASRFSTSAVQTSNTDDLLKGSKQYPMTYAVVALGKIKLRCYTIIWGCFHSHCKWMQVMWKEMGNSHLVCTLFLLTRSGCGPFCNILKSLTQMLLEGFWKINSPTVHLDFFVTSVSWWTWQISRWAGPIGHPSVYVKRLLKSDPSEASISQIHNVPQEILLKHMLNIKSHGLYNQITCLRSQTLQ